MIKFHKKKPQPELGRRHVGRRVKDSSPMYSYRSSRSDQETATGRLPQREEMAKLDKRNRLSRIQAVRLSILAVVAVVFLYMILSLSPNPKIVIITTTGTSQTFLQNTSVYQKVAARLFNSSKLNGNKVTVNTGAISRQLLQQFPELASASVTIPLLTGQPVIYVQSTQPDLILSSSNGSFVVDTNGKALQPASQVTALNKLRLPTVTDQSELRVTLDQQALSIGDINFIATIIGQLKAKSIQYRELTLPAASQELDVQLANQPYFIKFNLADTDALQQFGTFLATQTYLTSKNITPTSYIDVRVDGRAYYR